MATNVLNTVDLRQLGQMLQQVRKKAGITQADAAKQIDVARTTLVAIEKGERRLKPTELVKLARTYRCAVSDFVRPTSTAEPFTVQVRMTYSKKLKVVPLHYQHLAIEALDKGLITEGRFATLLGVDRLEARRIAETLREYSSGEEEAQLDLLNA